MTRMYCEGCTEPNCGDTAVLAMLFLPVELKHFPSGKCLGGETVALVHFAPRPSTVTIAGLV